MQCAATLALAVSLSASALSAQIAGTVRPDDNATGLYGVPSEEGYLPSVSAPLVRPVAAWSDDAMDLPLLSITEESWSPPIIAVPSLVVAWTDDGNDLPRLTIEEQEWFPPRPVVVASVPVVWRGDGNDLVVVAAPFWLDEQSWSPVLPPRPSSPVLAWRDDGGDVVTAPVTRQVLIGGITAIDHLPVIEAIDHTPRISAIEHTPRITSIDHAPRITAIDS